MVNWEPTLKVGDWGKKWAGDGRIIELQDPIWIKGFRFVMRSLKPFIGFYTANFYTQ